MAKRQTQGSIVQDLLMEEKDEKVDLYRGLSLVDKSDKR